MASMALRKNLYGLNALSAWTGFGLSAVIELFGLVEADPAVAPTSQTQFGYIGDYASGLAGGPERLFDLLSYFTIWSQLVVGIVMTILYRNPERATKWVQVFRIDALLMITVTGVVYNLLIGPVYPPQGLNKISSPIEHSLTPLITVLIFLFIGPRGWMNARNVGRALLLPISYIFYTLIRGAIINKYPYDFFDVGANGYASVIIFVMGILFASLIVLAMYWGIDKALSRKIKA
jgi:hypothetical protein